MRVLVAADRVGPLAPAVSGPAVARAFAAAGADCAVVPLPGGGRDLAEALAGVGLPCVAATAVPDEPLSPRSSRPLGEAVARALAARPAALAVDLSTAGGHDGGAGLLAALGATGDAPLDAGWPGLGGLRAMDLTAARAAVGGTDLVGVVPGADAELQLLGLRGVSAARAQEAGLPPTDAVTADAALERLAAAVDPDLARSPGAGAGGGAGYAVLALGGRLATGPEVLGQAAGLADTLAAADLVVAAVDQFDFGSRGGGAVAHLAPRCAERGLPLVVLARHVQISRREMRTFGVEEAVELGDVADAAALTLAATPVARGWRW